MMPDYLHPGEAGYKIWADAMEPKLKELLAELKPVAENSYVPTVKAD